MPHPPTHPDASVGLLTTREHFACEAMKGLLAQHSTAECESGARYMDPIYGWPLRHGLADRAVELADLLIAALNKPSVEQQREAERTND